MMELSKSFEPHDIERRWYPIWESRGYFAASTNSEQLPYCIQLPPPNVTGTKPRALGRSSAEDLWECNERVFPPSSDVIA